jgi:hypothetical protein
MNSSVRRVLPDSERIANLKIKVQMVVAGIILKRDSYEKLGGRYMGIGAL